MVTPDRLRAVALLVLVAIAAFVVVGLVAYLGPQSVTIGPLELRPGPTI